MKLGSVVPRNNVFLAPLAGVSDMTFRLLCVEEGCGLTYTEMVSAKGVCYRNVNTMALFETCPEERPVAAQLFGSEPGVVAEAVRLMAHLPFELIDLNMGCPVPKVFNNGEGAALMKNPKLAAEIVAAAVAATTKPVTVKMRAGVNESHVNAVEMAKAVEAAGAAAVAVHGRVRAQYYAGTADWRVIADVKRAVSIPVIGNGDVTNGESAAAMFAETGVDAVMVGRAALGNPWVFKDIAHYLETGEASPPVSAAQRAETALKHGRMLIAQKGEAVGVREMRKHFAWYTKGLPGSAKLRQKINAAVTYADLEASISELAHIS